LIKVAEKLESYCIDVVVVGYGRGSEVIGAYRGSNLIFYGMQPHDKTIEIIEKCHLGLCLRKNDPISKDSFPVKVWEYLGLGIPTIVTPRCEAGEFLEQNGCGCQFDSGSVGKIVEKINDIRSNPETACKMSSQARFVAAKFTREETGRTVAFEIKSAFAGSKI
jgi:glycosyltransferase involved in cell wall biosynthesis